MGKMMDLQQTFSDSDLEKVVDQAAIYMCACPAQVAEEISRIRNLIRYQRDCVNGGSASAEVHLTIEAFARQAHAMMEKCLDQVLEIEGWDRATLMMPEGLRVKRDEMIEKGE